MADELKNPEKSGFIGKNVSSSGKKAYEAPSWEVEEVFVKTAVMCTAQPGLCSPAAS